MLGYYYVLHNTNNCILPWENEVVKRGLRDQVFKVLGRNPHVETGVYSRQGSLGGVGPVDLDVV